MMDRMKKFALLLAPIALLAPAAAAQGLPDGEGRSTYENTCGTCHGGDIVIGSQGSRARWEETVEAMRNRGAYGSEADFEVVLNYLSKYFGMPVNVNTATAEDLQSQFQIKPEEAAAIVKHRTDNGEFKEWADFEKVAGIKIADFNLMKQRVLFAAPAGR